MRALPAILVVSTLVSCAGEHPDQGPEPTGEPPHAGRWRAVLDSPGGQLPFALDLARDGAAWRASVINGVETLPVGAVQWNGEAHVLTLDFAPYESVIEATVEPGGAGMAGTWRKRRGTERWTEMAFRAALDDGPRFLPIESDAQGDDPLAIVGRWAVAFEKDEHPAVGVFDGDTAGHVQGTFLTTLGDYRYLAGSFEHRFLRLSCFDGAHAFLFTAHLETDGSLSGDFWSSEAWHETWTGRRDDDAMLVDPFSLTEWRAPSDGTPFGDLAFPDSADGAVRRLDDESLGGTARVLVVFGTWCPNCRDATAWLADLHRRRRDDGLAVTGLAFELTGEAERDRAQVERYRQAQGIEFPVLLAGVADKADASAAFPLLDRVRAYPTTIVLDGDGRARAVHTGFSGPATGTEHERLIERLESLIDDLLDS